MEEETIEYNPNSVLHSIKKPMGLEPEDNSYDSDLIFHINSVFLDLLQLGVGSITGFQIVDEKDIWSDFIPDSVLQNSVKEYVYLRVRLLFDPPTSATLVESMNNSINRLEWRIKIQAEELV